MLFQPRTFRLCIAVVATSIVSCLVSAKISQIQAQATGAAQQKQEAAATTSVAAATAAAAASGTSAASAAANGDQATETEAKKEEVWVVFLLMLFVLFLKTVHIVYFHFSEKSSCSYYFPALMQVSHLASGLLS